MSAVLGCSFGGTTRRGSRKYVHAIMKECIDVARKSGIAIEKIQGKDPVLLFDYHGPLKRALGYLILPLAIAKHRKLKASMLQDLEAGKASEVDAINGVVCAYGRQCGVPTPFNDLVVSTVHAIERGERRPSMENLALFDAAAKAGRADVVDKG
jgi:2-dehydropantoate 2-reductase